MSRCCRGRRGLAARIYELVILSYLHRRDHGVRRAQTDEHFTFYGKG
jgi:hypothetical protein